MTELEELERLERRLRWEAPESLTAVSNQVTGSVFRAFRAVTEWLRESVDQHPLVALLIAFEAAFAVAWMGRWRAKH
jgi:hypothetical protein